MEGTLGYWCGTGVEVYTLPNMITLLVSDLCFGGVDLLTNEVFWTELA